MSGSAPTLELVQGDDFILPSISGYKLVHPLGRGANGRVFLFQDETTEKYFAFKFLDPTPTAIKQRAERGISDQDALLREALGKISEALPGVVYVTAERADDGTSFIKSEYIDRTLHSRLEAGSLPLEEIVAIGTGFAQGLASLHTEKMAHGDAHPGNVGYSTRGLVKLLDFGTATVGLDERVNVGWDLVRAPERFNSGEIRAPSDIWAWGSNMYRMFTGEFFLEKEKNEGKNLGDLIATHIDSGTWNTFVQNRLSTSGIVKSWRSLLYRCLVTEENRIQNGSQLLKEIQRTQKQYDRSKPFSRFVRYTAAAVLTLCIGVEGYFLHQHNQDTEKLEAKLTELMQSKEYHQKALPVRLYMGGARTSDNPIEHAQLGQLEGYHGLLGDFKTACAAFYNPKATYLAVKRHGGDTDFDTIGETLRQIDENTYWFAFSVNNNYLDNVFRSENYRQRMNVVKDWQALEGVFDRRCEQLVDQYEKIRKDMRKVRKIPSGGMLTGIEHPDLTELKEERYVVTNALHTVTGKSWYDIDKAFEGDTEPYVTLCQEDQLARKEGLE